MAVTDSADVGAGEAAFEPVISEVVSVTQFYQGTFIMNLFTRALISVKIRINKRLFQQGDYLKAYAEHTNLKAQIDPAMAIGGLWDEMGKHQFEFLQSKGLEPQHKLLDIGCGSLRGGCISLTICTAGTTQASTYLGRLSKLARRR